MSPSPNATDLEPTVPLPPRRRRYSQHSPVGQRRLAQQCARRPRRPRLCTIAPPLYYRTLAGDAARARLLQWAATAPGRTDGRATRAAVVDNLLRQYRFEEDGVIVGGHEQWARQITAARGRRIARSTVQRIIAEMVAAGVLHIAQAGVSAAITGTTNMVAVYAVIEPDPAGVEALRAGAALAARLADESVVAGQALDGYLPVGEVDCEEVDGSTALLWAENWPTEPARREHPERYVPRNRDEQIHTLLWLIAQLAWRAGYERGKDHAEALRGRVWKFFAAGWTGEALLIGLHRSPDGLTTFDSLRDDDPRIRSLYGVLVARLDLWCTGPAGRRTPLPPPRPPAPLRRGRRPAAAPTASPAAVPARTAPPGAARAYLAGLGLTAGAPRPARTLLRGPRYRAACAR